jgi:type II secretory pathway component GspD/PulD (secretin)
VLGVLFRHSTDGRERTNLMIFVTPHIVTDSVAALAMTTNWEGATGLSGTLGTNRVIETP